MDTTKMDPIEIQREAERLIGEDRVPLDVLREMVGQYGSTPTRNYITVLIRFDCESWEVPKLRGELASAVEDMVMSEGEALGAELEYELHHEAMFNTML